MRKLLWFGAFILMAREAQATVAVELGGPELVVVSDVIVHARVINLGGHVTLNPTRVFTDADLQVIEGVKGAAAGDVLHVTFPGGVHNGLGMFVSGQVAFGANQECVIYLRRLVGSSQPQNSYMPSAMRQGFFAVQTRAYDGVRMAVKNTSGLALLSKKGKVQTLNETPKVLVRPLPEVLNDIRVDMKTAESIDPKTVLGGVSR